MRKINIILIILLLLQSAVYCPKDNSSDFFSNFMYTRNSSIEQTSAFIKENNLLIMTSIAAIYFHSTITESFKEQPYISSIYLLILIHYICDTTLNYQHQQSILELIQHIKKIAFYLIVSLGIKNHIHQKKLVIESIFDEEAFFDAITEHIPYSFQEIRLITLKSYLELKSMLQGLNKSIDIESEECIFLSHTSSITINTLLYLSQNDNEMHSYLIEFEKDPHLHFQPIIQFLAHEIMITFLELNKNLFSFQIPSIQKRKPLA